MKRTKRCGVCAEQKKVPSFVVKARDDDSRESRAMTIETPCINVCTIDPNSGLCAGCGRSLDEIARWSTMTPAERRRIMSELAERKRRPNERHA